MSQHDLQWIEVFKMAVTLYNASGHQNLRGMSPNMCHYNLTRVNHPSIFEVLEKTPGSSQVEEVERKHIMRARKILLQEFQTNQFRKSDKYERSSKRKETSNLYEEGDFVLAQFMGDAPKFSGKALFFGPGCIARLQGQEAEIFWPHLGRTSIRNTNNLIHFALPAGGIQRSDFQNMPRITKMQNGRMI